jgi:hypothetical protein
MISKNVVVVVVFYHRGFGSSGRRIKKISINILYQLPDWLINTNK